MTAKSPRTGRRSGPSKAREDILAAARELFATSGFSTTTLRAVAARAGVDVALIPYYFGNKRGLFVAAMELPIDPAERLRTVIDGPREELGSRLAATFLTVWDDDVTGPTLQAFLRSAVSDAPTAQAFGEFVSQAMLPLIAGEADVSVDTARVLASMLFGVATMRYLIAAPAYAEPRTAELIAIYGPSAQAVIDAG